MLRLPDSLRTEIVGYCREGLPYEACGLLAGSPGDDAVERWYPARNADESALTYTIDSRDQLRADRDAEDAGLEIIGVFHSHTHTRAYPSPTDVAKAPDPAWHYVLVSLQYSDADVRSYRIQDGTITEEPVELL